MIQGTVYTDAAKGRNKRRSHNSSLKRAWNMYSTHALSCQ